VGSWGFTGRLPGRIAAGSLASALVACGGTGTGPTVPSETVPAVADPPTSQAIQAARDYSFSVGGQTFLVLYLGRTMDEGYANGGGPDTPQLLASATKSLTGMIGAIAASEGLFRLDEPVAQRALVEWQSDPQKSRITYRHLLTMTSGLGWSDDVAGWLDFLNEPSLHPAGSTFLYGGDPNLLGLALERRLGGEAVVDYFDRKLFRPLGIASIRWEFNFPDGRPQLAGGAFLTARDLAKFGEFVRRTTDGTWDGPPLLSRPFFDQVFAGSAAHPAYGFYWWLKKPVPADLAAIIDANNGGQYTRTVKPIVDDPRVPDDFVMAVGAYDQRLYVIPSLGLTVVRNGPVGATAFEDVPFLDRLLGGTT
jgi:CubicO group peptidase (beta-lactamase class C family)